MPDLPKTVEHLSLTKNNLTYLPSDAFSGLRHLRKLTLDYNSIRSVERFAFRGLGRLRELSIQHTQLDSLKKFSFAGLQNVTAILLGYNNISVIDEFAFAGTANIRLILLNNNPLLTVSVQALNRLSHALPLIPVSNRLIFQWRRVGFKWWGKCLFKFHFSFLFYIFFSNVHLFYLTFTLYELSKF